MSIEPDLITNFCIKFTYNQNSFYENLRYNFIDYVFTHFHWIYNFTFNVCKTSFIRFSL